MAFIPYTKHNFPVGSISSPPPKLTSRPKPTRPTSTTTGSDHELARCAATIGDTALLLGGPGRSSAEVEWRQAMIRSSLVRVGRYWAKSAGYSRLDGSEKTAVSYFLGMVQAGLMALKVLGVPHLVHVDAVLKLLSRPKKYSSTTTLKRPDLVGYQRSSAVSQPRRTLVEAKGRSNGWENKAVQAAVDQLAHTSSPARQLVGSNPLLVASLAYFDHWPRRMHEVWTSYLEDPPASTQTTTDFTESEFRGLVDTAALRPIAAAIGEAQDHDESRFRHFDITEIGMVAVVLPSSGILLGLPRSLCTELLSTDQTITLRTASRIASIAAEASESVSKVVGQEIMDWASPWENAPATIAPNGVLVASAPLVSG